MRSENTFLLARAGLVVTQVRERVASSLSCIAQTCMDWVWTSEHSIKEIIISKYRSSLYWICFGKWRVWSEGKERYWCQSDQSGDFLINFLCLFSFIVGQQFCPPTSSVRGERGDNYDEVWQSPSKERRARYHWTISDLVGVRPPDST